MKYSPYVLFVLLFFCISASADIIEDFQTAHSFYSQGKYAQAADAFAGLAAATSGYQQEQARLYQALALGRARKLTEALKTAEALRAPELKRYAGMEIWMANRKYRETAAEYTGEKFSGWPEEWRSRGHHLLGQALGFTGKYQQALVQLNLAVKTAGDNLEQKYSILNDISNFAISRKDYPTVLKTAEEILTPEFSRKYHGSYLYLRPALNQAEALLATGKNQEAEKCLDEILHVNRGRIPHGIWQCHHDFLMGEVKSAQGRKDAARRSYENAVKNAPNSPFGKLARKKLDTLKQGEPL